MPQKGRIGLVVFNIILIGLATLSFALRRQERTMRLSVEALADRLAAQLADVNLELDEVRGQARESQKNFETVLSERDALTTNLRERDQFIRQMRLELAQLKLQVQKVNLGSVVVPAPGLPQGEIEEMATQPSSGSSSEGNVVAVNDEFHFVVVNLGAKNGIREGATLALIRNGTSAGNLRVDLVDETVCAAAPLSNISHPVKIGDTIRAT